MIQKLLGQNFKLKELLEVSGLARSTYFYSKNHPPRPTRPELSDKVLEIFRRTANGSGHRQIAMCLRAEYGVRISNKTVLKMMHKLGIQCTIRRKSAYRRYNSYKAEVGKISDNLICRKFSCDRPWTKMGTDVTEFKQS